MLVNVGLVALRALVPLAVILGLLLTLLMVAMAWHYFVPASVQFMVRLQGLRCGAQGGHGVLL
jgi:hypothetical protein